MLIMCEGQEWFHTFKNTGMVKYSIIKKMKYYSIRLYDFLITIFCTT